MSRTRTIQDIVSIAYAELNRLARKEGPDGLALLSRCEFTADFEKGKGRCRIHLQIGREVVWTGYASVTEDDVQFLADEELVKRVLTPIRDSMSLVGLEVHAAVDRLFPKSVRKVDVEYSVEQAERKFAVLFQNGHVAEVMESELRTEIFVARCSMLYDLPPL